MKRFVVSLVCVALVGCTAFRPLERHDAATIRAEVEVGDEVVVGTHDGKAYRFVVTQVTATELVGTRERRRYRVPLESIEAVEVKRMSVGDTATNAATAVVGAAAVVLALVGAGLLYTLMVNEE